MRVIAEQNWSWLMFEDAGRFYLSVVCGDESRFTIDFALDDLETETLQASTEHAVSNLAQRVQAEPAVWRQKRHIARFYAQPGVAEAVAAWRLENPI